MINYLLHSSLLLLLSFAFYKLFLQKETLFSLNRYAVLLMVFFSLTLPIFEVPANWSFRENSKNLVEFVTPKNADEFQNSLKKPSKHSSKESVVGTAAHEPPTNINAMRIVYWIYTGGVIIFAVTFVIQLIQLKVKSRRLEYIQDGDFRIYELEGQEPPFSFFNSIYVNPSLYEFETYEQILAHEKLHIKNRHFIDKLLGELLTIFFWFNPFAWLLRKSITNNLEFETDDAMLRNGVEQESYQMSLLKVSVNQHPLSFTTNYNQSILEQRIRMMSLKKSSFRCSWKYLLILPLFGLSLFSFNATDAGSKDNDSTKGNYLYNYDHIEEITMETSFGTNSDKNTLIIANVTGKVFVQGHDKETIDINIKKKINAPTNEQIEKGVSEIKVGNRRGENSFALFLNSPYSNFDLESQTFSYSENCEDNPCFDYQFQLDYTVKVPKNANLVVQNVNGGDITVENLHGNNLKIKHVTGSIELKNIVGSSQIETISGNIVASYSQTPKGESSFKTISGFIDASFPEDFSGSVYQKAGDGIFNSDFEIGEEFLKNGKPKSDFKIGLGKSSFRFETTSGDIRLKSN